MAQSHVVSKGFVTIYNASTTEIILDTVIRWLFSIRMTLYPHIGASLGLVNFFYKHAWNKPETFTSPNIFPNLIWIITFVSYNICL